MNLIRVISLQFNCRESQGNTKPLTGSNLRQQRAASFQIFDRNIVRSNQSYTPYLVPYLDSLTAPQGKPVESRMLCFSQTFPRCSEAFRVDFDYQYEMICLFYIHDIFWDPDVLKVFKTNMRQSGGFPLGLDKVQSLNRIPQ